MIAQFVFIAGLLLLMVGGASTEGRPGRGLLVMFIGLSLIGAAAALG